jgi:hypothetical protein
MAEAVDGDFVVASKLVVAFCEIAVGEENVGAVEDRLGELEIESFGSDCGGPQRIPNLLSTVESWRCFPELITFAS